MKQLWVVVVLIWYICVNETFLFTRAGPQYFTSTFEYGIIPTIECNQSVINIENISIKDKETTCPLSTRCDVTQAMVNNIKQKCDGCRVCLPDIQLQPTCLTDQRYLNITFDCSVRSMACNFEKNNETCDWILSGGWKRRNGSYSINRKLPDKDVTTSSNYGHYLYLKDRGNDSLTSRRIFPQGQWKCLTFWYNTNSSKSVLKIYQKEGNSYTHIKLKTNMGHRQKWTQEIISLPALIEYNIVFQAHPSKNEYIALDDIDLHDGACLNLIAPGNVTTTFEHGLGNWATNQFNSDGWILQKAEDRTSTMQPSTDYTTATRHGHYLSFQSNGTGIVKMSSLTATAKCLTFWYYFKGSGVASIKIIRRIALSSDESLGVINKTSEGEWIKTAITIDENLYFTLILEGTLYSPDDCIAMDDISIKDGYCAGNDVNERMCADATDENIIECSTETLDFDKINVKMDPQFDKTDDQCKDTENNIQNILNEVCVKNNTCTLKPTHFFSQNKKQCLLFNRSIVFHVNYSCRESHDRMMCTNHPCKSCIASQDGTASMSSTISGRTETKDGTASMSSTISGRTETKDVSARVSTQIPPSTHGSQETTFKANQSQSPNKSVTIGVTVGVVLVILVAVCLILGMIYLRRSRSLEKKSPSNEWNANNHIDYTGHQNIAFSPEVNVTTQTDYCEIRNSKYNEQYHDISDTFGPLINTANDDEYSEIANVVSTSNINPNASTNYQTQYISLDSNVTGFNRSNPEINLHNESKINDDSNEKSSFTSGDDYATLDPDDPYQSKNYTPKVLPLSDNYVVLDPNETGFNRQENTETVSEYELATPFNPTETSEDPYDVSKDETYDSSSNSRHKEKENNIYSHMVDNEYDTAGNQRKEEDSDGTYDHFFGQKSEDDYDISKPL